MPTNSDILPTISTESGLPEKQVRGVFDSRNVIIKTQHGCVARFQVGRKQRVFRANIVALETVVSTVGMK